MRKIITAVVAPLLLALCAMPSMAGIVFQQVYDGKAITYGSQNDKRVTGSGDFAKVYDNFLLTDPKSITDVHWTGGYFSGDKVTIDSFRIQFWADASGQPGQQVYDTTISGVANETPISGSAAYSYEVDLGTAFDALANTSYWLSIQANMPFPPQWGWGTSGDGQSYQDLNFPNEISSRDPLNFNMAFSLTSTPTSVPEPGSLLLAGLALAALFGTTRAKKVA